MTDRTIRNLANLSGSASTARVLNLSRVHREHGHTDAWAEAPLFINPVLNRSLIIKHRLRRDEVVRAAVGDYEAYSLFHLGGAYDVSDRVTVNATLYNLFDEDFVRLVPYGAPVAYTPEYANNQEPRRLYVAVTATF